MLKQIRTMLIRPRDRSELQIKLGVKLIYVNLHKRTIRVEGRVEELRT